LLKGIKKPKNSKTSFYIKRKKNIGNNKKQG